VRHTPADASSKAPAPPEAPTDLTVTVDPDEPAEPEPAPAGRHQRTARPAGRWLVAAAAALLLAQFAAAMAWASKGDAPTYDEPAHLAAGASYLTTRDLRLNFEHPPLVKALAAVPLVAARVRLPSRAELAAGEQNRLGHRLLYELGNNPGRVLLLGRLPMMGLAALLALAVFGFATDLFGARAALVPLALVTLDPNLVAHGRLVATDVGVTLFLLVTAWMLYRAARWRPAIWVAAAGVAFGLALGCKYSALLAAPVVAALASAAGWAQASRRVRGHQVPSALRRAAAAAGAAAVVGGLALVTVWAVYLAIDPHLGGAPKRIQVAGPLAALADLLPLPATYRAGLRFVLYYDQVERPAYLLGQRYAGGRADFYPVVLALKTPLGALAAWALTFVLALVGLAWPHQGGRARHAGTVAAVAGFVLAPAAWLLLLAVTSGTNIGLRHVLLVPVAAAVACGLLGADWRPARPWPRLARNLGSIPAVLAVVLVAATGVSSWRAEPHPLAYVNEAFGGPGQGWRLVADSNLDWGQDLARAAAWERARPDRLDDPVWLLYFGTGDPEAYGLEAIRLAPASRTVRPERVRGTVLVSASALALYDTPLTQRLRAEGTQVGQIGHSILVYQLP
jgi:4-amino-4-deoxy-L-arabinose transferase-like glycosyltransferase